MPLRFTKSLRDPHSSFFVIIHNHWSCRMLKRTTMTVALIVCLLASWHVDAFADAIAEWSNFTEFCNECVIASECKCDMLPTKQMAYAVFCNGSYVEPAFPTILNSSNSNCTNFYIIHGNGTVKLDFAFKIENYTFSEIQNYSINIQPRNFIRIYLTNNQYLRYIHSKAFIINGSTSLFSIDGSAMTELPTDVLPSLQLQLPPNLPIALRFRQSKFINLMKLRSTLNNLTALISSIDLDGNNFAGMPSGMFQRLMIMECLNLNNNKITYLPERAFHSLTLRDNQDTYISLTGNPIARAAPGAFTSVIASVLNIELVEDGNYSPKTVFVAALKSVKVW